eukprot:m.53017 g.53017  ORF g.53017 m.53017 type:complete len:207 (+) comp11024_c0_seq1:738-1358(+)
MTPWSGDTTEVNILNELRGKHPSRTLSRSALKRGTQTSRTINMAKKVASKLGKTSFAVEPILRSYIELEHGREAFHQSIVKVGTSVCSGSVTVWDDQAENTEWRFLVLTEKAGKLLLFRSDKQEDEIVSLDTRSIIRCFQKDDKDSFASNSFMVVSPSDVFQFGVGTAESLRIWVSAIMHSTMVTEKDIEDYNAATDFSMDPFGFS